MLILYIFYELPYELRKYNLQAIYMFIISFLRQVEYVSHAHIPHTHPHPPTKRSLMILVSFNIVTHFSRHFIKNTWHGLAL